MPLFLGAVGTAAVAVGIGLVPPVLLRRLEHGETSAAGWAILLGAAGLTWGGLVVLCRRMRRGEVRMPSAVRSADAAGLFVLGFCALEFADGVVRQGGRLVYWTSALFLPALATHFGLVLACPWAWKVARLGAAVAAAWFLGFLFLIPFVDLRGEGRPVPTSGRIYMSAVTIGFAVVAATAFRALGHGQARAYFRPDDAAKRAHERTSVLDVREQCPQSGREVL